MLNIAGRYCILKKRIVRGEDASWDIRKNLKKKKDDYAFLQETIKDENGGHNKLRNIVLKYAGLGLVFGLAACIGFCALTLGRGKIAGNPQKITIPEEEEEENRSRRAGRNAGGADSDS